MKGNMFINLNPKRFSQYTLKTIIFLTSQSKHASYNTRTNEISRYKGQIKVQHLWKSPTSKQVPCKWRRCQRCILLNLWEKCLPFGENWRNIQTIYDSVRKELQDECHCAWSLLKVTRTCPIVREDGWEVESLIVPGEVLLVWNHSTSRRGCVYCSKVGGH